MKPRKTVQSMTAYLVPEESREGFLRLDLNENTIGCPQRIVSAIQKGLTRESLAIYPSYKELRSLISRYTGLPQSCILPTNGTEEAIKCVMDAYTEGKDQVLVPTPTFSLYELYAAVSGARIRTVPYEGMNFPLDKLLRAINSRTRVIVIANPNNPTGTLLSKQVLLKIIKSAGNALVLLDEAYYHFSGLTMKSYIRKYPNLVVIQTFSKAFGLAGLRLGYVLSQPQNIEILRKVQSPYSVNRAAVIAAQAVLENKKYVAQYTSEVKRARQLLRQSLKRWQIPSFPSAANFILARLGWFATPVAAALKQDGILVKQVIPGWLRLGVGTVSQTRRLISSLAKILKRRVLIFDFDGVLVDVSRSYYYAIRETVRYFSRKRIALKLIKNMKLKGGYNNDWVLTYELLRRLDKRIPFATVKRYFQSCYWGRNFDGLIRDERWLLDPKILKQLSANYTLAIVTGRPRRETNYTLNRWGLKRFFSSIITLDDLPEKYQKPHPAGILQALKHTKAIYGIYFGDNPDDMIAGTRAGITGVGVLPPQNRSLALRRVLKARGASIILSDINQIAEVFNETKDSKT